MIIGFGHRSRVGKDTACEYLRDNHGFHHFSFAYELKKLAHHIYGYLGVHEPEHYEKHPEARNRIIPALSLTVVQVWVHMNKLRSIYANLYIDMMFREIARQKLDVDTDNICISDVRQPNEVAFIGDIGGLVVRIDRPGQPAVSGASIDNNLNNFDSWDYILVNDGTIDELNLKVKDILDDCS